jgi:uncharacterized protein involved in exopolysaccharide biosynthesis
MSSNPVSTEQDLVDPSVVSEPLRVHEYEGPTGHPLFSRLRLLVDYRFFVLRVTACGLVLATVLAFLIRPTYESRTQLMPPDSEFSSGLASLLAMNVQSGSGLGMIAGELLGLKTSGSLFVGILRSRTVEDRIIDKFDLKSVYNVRRMQDARRILEENTQMSEDRKSGIITIAVADHSPQRATAIAESYISELDRLVVELNTSAAHRERIFLEGRLKSVKQDLDSSAKQLSEFSSKNATIDIKDEGRAMLDAAAILQGHLIAAQSELEGLRQIFSDGNVRVRAARARVDELQKKLDQMGGVDPAATAPAGVADSVYPSLRKLPLLAVTYSELYRNTKIQETLFELLTQQAELAKVQEAKETPSVKVLDSPVIPEKKSFPPRLLIMFLGALFAFMLGTLWTLGKASWQGTDPRHPGKLLAMETYTKIKGDLGLTSGNGNGLRHVADKILWFKRPPNQP